jgi:molybdenum cofactor guanylyltransferase
MIDLEAFVLIGGRSSRLGSDKAFAELGGMTLAQRAARTSEEAFSDVRVTFVAASDSQFGFDAAARLARPVVADLRPGFGAWSGVHTALAYARSEWVFVLACDYPFVTPRLLTCLASFAKSDQHAVAPVQPDGRLQPLCALYRASMIGPQMEIAFDAGRQLPPLRVFIEGKNIRRVASDEYSDAGDADKLFLNINTPEDLARAGDMAK